MVRIRLLLLVGIVQFCLAPAAPAQWRRNARAAAPAAVPQVPISVLAGPPPFEVFLPEQYASAPENYTAVQDGRGVLYVANERGVLEFDGARWRLIVLSNRKPAYSLAVSDSGRVYVGGDGEFGYLKPGYRGQLVYHSLSANTPGAVRAGRVRSVLVVNEGVMFAADRALFRFDGTQTRALTVNHTRRTNGASNLLLVGGKLCRPEGNDLFPVSTAGIADTQFVALTRYDASQYLVASSRMLYLYNGYRWLPVETRANDILRSAGITSVAVLEGGRYAVGTSRGGVFLLLPDGKFQTAVNLAAGLPTEAVNGLYYDDQNGLWALLDKGVARIELNTPVSLFAESDGLKGGVNDMLRVGGNLYVATTRGVFVLDGASVRARFRTVRGILANSWFITTVQAGGAQRVLAGTAEGVYDVSGDSARMVFPAAISAMCRSRKYPDRLYCAVGQEVFMLVPPGAAAAPQRRGLFGRRNAAPVAAGPLLQRQNIQASIPAEVTALVEEPDGQLVLLTRKGLFRLAIPEGTADAEAPTAAVVSPMGTAEALPNGPITLFRAFGRTLLGTSRGVLTFNSFDNTFAVDTLLTDWAGVPVSYVHMAPNGWVLLESRGRIFVGRRQPDKSWQWSSREFARYRNVQLTFGMGEGATEWLGLDNGLLRFDTEQPKRFDYPFRTLLRQVAFGANDSLAFGGAFGGNRAGYVGTAQDTFALDAYESGFGRIRFEFGATSYEQSPRNEYRYRLEGLDTTWSGWSTATQADYNNLEPGEYTFWVQGRNAYGVPGPETRFRFTVEPQWHETWLATVFFWLLGLAAVGGLIWLGVRGYLYRLRVQNERLQRLVDERTQELRNANTHLQESNEMILHQKHELMADKKIIEAKNHEIQESIVYASRIQASIFPEQEGLRRLAPQSFIFWRPRDIVSGDFFWFAEVDGNILVSAADCTGHGVPGAFMTMIGNTLLNEIVQRDRITRPDEILNRLHVGVRNTLSQDKTDSKDGMDIVFLCIDRANQQVHFAGANNPLVRIHQGEAHKVESDAQAIGGRQDEAERRFTLHTFPLVPGDVFYLFTDGFQDQFGGERGKKYMAKKFRDLLQGLSTHPMDEQRAHLAQEFDTWLGTEYEQIDDVLVLGVRV